MHELTLCKNILAVIEEEAERAHASQIKRVTLEIGELTCVDKDVLKFVFIVACKNSLAENAQLEIQSTPGRAICQSCQGESFELQQRLQACPNCNKFSLQIIQGDELLIKNIEVI